MWTKGSIFSTTCSYVTRSRDVKRYMRARNSGISHIWVSWISAVACIFIRNLLFSFLNTRIRELRKLIKAHKQCINSWNSYLAYCDGKFNIRSTKLFDLHNTTSLKHGFKIKSSESHYKDLFKFTFYYVHRIFLPKHSYNTDYSCTTRIRQIPMVKA